MIKQLASFNAFFTKNSLIIRTFNHKCYFCTKPLSNHQTVENVCVLYFLEYLLYNFNGRYSELDLQKPYSKQFVLNSEFYLQKLNFLSVITEFLW